jgi:hypothetical protein
MPVILLLGRQKSGRLRFKASSSPYLESLSQNYPTQKRTVGVI